jgi:hypothetical protein
MRSAGSASAPVAASIGGAPGTQPPVAAEDTDKPLPDKPLPIEDRKERDKGFGPATALFPCVKCKLMVHWRKMERVTKWGEVPADLKERWGTAREMADVKAGRQDEAWWHERTCTDCVAEREAITPTQASDREGSEPRGALPQSKR